MTQSGDKSSHLWDTLMDDNKQLLTFAIQNNNQTLQDACERLSVLLGKIISSKSSPSSTINSAFEIYLTGSVSQISKNEQMTLVRPIGCAFQSQNHKISLIALKMIQQLANYQWIPQNIYPSIIEQLGNQLKLFPDNELFHVKILQTISTLFNHTSPSLFGKPFFDALMIVCTFLRHLKRKKTSSNTQTSSPDNSSWWNPFNIGILGQKKNSENDSNDEIGLNTNLSSTSSSGNQQSITSTMGNVLGAFGFSSTDIPTRSRSKSIGSTISHSGLVQTTAKIVFFQILSSLTLMVSNILKLQDEYLEYHGSKPLKGSETTFSSSSQSTIHQLEPFLSHGSTSPKSPKISSVELESTLSDSRTDSSDSNQNQKSPKDFKTLRENRVCQITMMILKSFILLVSNQQPKLVFLQDFNLEFTIQVLISLLGSKPVSELCIQFPDIILLLKERVCPVISELWHSYYQPICFGIGYDYRTPDQFICTSFETKLLQAPLPSSDTMKKISNCLSLISIIINNYTVSLREECEMFLSWILKALYQFSSVSQYLIHNPTIKKPHLGSVDHSNDFFFHYLSLIEDFQPNQSISNSFKSVKPSLQTLGSSSSLKLPESPPLSLVYFLIEIVTRWSIDDENEGSDGLLRILNSQFPQLFIPFTAVMTKILICYHQTNDPLSLPQISFVSQSAWAPVEKSRTATSRIFRKKNDHSGQIPHLHSDALLAFFYFPSNPLLNIMTSIYPSHSLAACHYSIKSLSKPDSILWKKLGSSSGNGNMGGNPNFNITNPNPPHGPHHSSSKPGYIRSSSSSFIPTNEDSGKYHWSVVLNQFPMFRQSIGQFSYSYFFNILKNISSKSKPINEPFLVCLFKSGFFDGVLLLLRRIHTCLEVSTLIDSVFEFMDRLSLSNINDPQILKFLSHFFVGLFSLISPIFPLPIHGLHNNFLSPVEKITPIIKSYLAGESISITNLNNSVMLKDETRRKSVSPTSLVSVTGNVNSSSSGKSWRRNRSRKSSKADTVVVFPPLLQVESVLMYKLLVFFHKHHKIIDSTIVSSGWFQCLNYVHFCCQSTNQKQSWLSEVSTTPGYPALVSSLDPTARKNPSPSHQKYNSFKTLIPLSQLDPQSLFVPIASKSLSASSSLDSEFVSINESVYFLISNYLDPINPHLSIHLMNMISGLAISMTKPEFSKWVPHVFTITKSLLYFNSSSVDSVVSDSCYFFDAKPSSHAPPATLIPLEKMPKPTVLISFSLYLFRSCNNADYFDKFIDIISVLVSDSLYFHVVISSLVDFIIEKTIHQPLDLDGIGGTLNSSTSSFSNIQIPNQSEEFYTLFFKTISQLHLPLDSSNSVVLLQIIHRSIFTLLNAILPLIPPSSPSYPLFLDILLQVALAHADTSSNTTVAHEGFETVLSTAFETVKLISESNLASMSDDDLLMVIRVVGAFGLQTFSVIISLSSIPLLSNLADSLRKKTPIHSTSLTKQMETVQSLWLALFRQFERLCHDSRAQIRNGAVQSFFAALSNHCKPQRPLHSSDFGDPPSNHQNSQMITDSDSAIYPQTWPTLLKSYIWPIIQNANTNFTVLFQRTMAKKPKIKVSKISQAEERTGSKHVSLTSILDSWVITLVSCISHFVELYRIHLVDFIRWNSSIIDNKENELDEDAATFQNPNSLEIWGNIISFFQKSASSTHIAVATASIAALHDFLIKSPWLFSLDPPVSTGFWKNPQRKIWDDVWKAWVQVLSVHCKEIYDPTIKIKNSYSIQITTCVLESISECYLKSFTAKKSLIGSQEWFSSVKNNLPHPWINHVTVDRVFNILSISLGISELPQKKNLIFSLPLSPWPFELPDPLDSVVTPHRYSSLNTFTFTTPLLQACLNILQLVSHSLMSAYMYSGSQKMKKTSSTLKPKVRGHRRSRSNSIGLVQSVSEEQVPSISKSTLFRRPFLKFFLRYGIEIDWYLPFTASQTRSILYSIIADPLHSSIGEVFFAPKQYSCFSSTDTELFKSQSNDHLNSASSALREFFSHIESNIQLTVGLLLHLCHSPKRNLSKNFLSSMEQKIKIQAMFYIAEIIDFSPKDIVKTILPRCIQVFFANLSLRHDCILSQPPLDVEPLSTSISPGKCENFFSISSQISYSSIRLFLTFDLQESVNQEFFTMIFTLFHQYLFPSLSKTHKTWKQKTLNQFQITRPTTWKNQYIGLPSAQNIVDIVAFELIPWLMKRYNSLPQPLSSSTSKYYEGTSTQLTSTSLKKQTSHPLINLGIATILIPCITFSLFNGTIKIIPSSLHKLPTPVFQFFLHSIDVAVQTLARFDKDTFYSKKISIPLFTSLVPFFYEHNSLIPEIEIPTTTGQVLIQFADSLGRIDPAICRTICCFKYNLETLPFHDSPLAEIFKNPRTSPPLTFYHLLVDSLVSPNSQYTSRLVVLFRGFYKFLINNDDANTLKQ